MDKLKKQIKDVLYIGSKNLGLKALQQILRICPESIIHVITIEDQDDNRSKLTEFKKICHQYSIPIFIAKTSKEANDKIRNLKFELSFVVGWYWIIPDDLLKIPEYGFIGVHNSLLPQYRGGAPLIWAILNNEKKTGVSFFTLTSKMDEGHIWAKGEVTIEKKDYIQDLLHKIEKKTEDVLSTVYLDILKHKIKPIQQSTTHISYGSLRVPDDGQINWTHPAEYIYNFIRAQAKPYPCAFTYSHNKKVKVLKAEVFSYPYFGTPGQVAQIIKNEVVIICGDNKGLIIKEVEIDKKKELPSKAFSSIRQRLTS